MNKRSFQKLESSQSEYEWYKENINRSDAEELLSNFDVGGFVVRKSESVKNAYVLSVKVPAYFSPKRISHFILIQDKNFIRFKGHDDKKFKDIDQLIAYCCNIRNILPVKLDSKLYQSKIHHKFVRVRAVSLESVSTDFSDFSDI